MACNGPRVRASLDLQALRAQAKKKLRERQISRIEMTRMVNEAARAFDELYSDALRAARTIADALPPEATEIPLRKLVSSDESWAKVQALGEMVRDNENA